MTPPYVDPDEDRTSLVNRPYLPKWLEPAALDARVGAGVEPNLPARLGEAALNATYVIYVDSVTGLPLVGKHVIIKVDQTLDEIADIVVEDI